MEDDNAGETAIRQDNSADVTAVNGGTAGDDDAGETAIM